MGTAAVPSKFSKQVFSIWEAIFPLSYCDHQIESIRKYYESEAKSARSPDEAACQLDVARHEADEFAGKRELILTERVMALSRKFDVSIEDIPIPSGQLKHWQVDSYGNRYLLARSRVGLSRAAWKVKSERWDFRLKVVSTIGGILIGIIGAAIGLITLLNKSHP